MIEAVKMAKKLDCDLYLVGAVQEESGLRGAGSAAFSIMPDLALSIEGTLANDIPGTAPHKAVAAQGKGPEIRFCDRRIIADREWSNFIVELANKRNIPHQVIVKMVGTTNATAIQTTASGIRATALSIPVRYLHSGHGIVQKSDIENAISLVAAIIEELSSFNIPEE